MNRIIVSKAILSSALFCAFWGVAEGRPEPSSPRQAQQKQAPDSKKTDSKSGSTLTGCIDEQDGRYVLVDDRNLNAVANLEADGFPTEGFAKHLGHKVTVRGISSPGSERPSFKVRSIEPVSDTCGSH